MALKTIIELADTTQGSIGSLIFPTKWLTSIVDGGKKRFYAAQFAYTAELGQGQKDIGIPVKNTYLGSGAFSDNLARAEAGSYTFTTMNNMSSVTVEPVDKTAGIELGNRVLRINALDLMKLAREELTYAAGDEVDQRVVNAMTQATAATSTVRGGQTIYGGDATQSSELGAGDIFTVDMIAEGKRKLQSSVCKYWTLGTGEAVSSGAKNPWVNEPSAPFVAMLAPEQEEALLTDSQFVNASEYGDASIVHNGEVGSYLGVKIIISPNTEDYAAATTARDGTTAGVALHECVMFKAQKAAALVWGQKPRLVVFDYPSELCKRIILEQAFQTKALYNDAIVWISVTDD